MGGNRPREVHNNDNAFSKIKFKIPSFDGKFDPCLLLHHYHGRIRK
jgi:hypothetical protein